MVVPYVGSHWRTSLISLSLLSSIFQHVLYLLLRWNVNFSRAAVLKYAAIRICVEELVAFLYSFHVAFPHEFRWHSYMEGFPFYFIKRSSVHMVDNLSIAVHVLPMHKTRNRQYTAETLTGGDYFDNLALLANTYAQAESPLNNR